MTRIKICGCMRVADVLAAAQAGADFIGIVFADSRRRVSREEAALIVRAAGAPLREMGQDEPPPLHPGRFDSIEAWFTHGADALDRLLARKRPLVVGVFEDQPIEEVNEIADETGIDLIQLSGNEPWSDCLLANRQAIKVIRTHGRMTSPDILSRIEPDAALAVMLDPSRGTGATAGWHAAADVAARIPLWLAGGLTPDTVAAAITTVRPWAVDVSSGVETDGAKDGAKIAAFIANARAVPAARPRLTAKLPRPRVEQMRAIERPRRSSPRHASFPYRGGYKYHLVFLTYKREHLFASADWAVRAISHLLCTAADTNFEIEAYSVMPDHIHVLAAGDAGKESELQRFTRGFKQTLGFEYKRATGRQLWHRSYYDHVLRPGEPAQAHVAYILNNPVAAGFVETADRWPFSGPELMLPVATGLDRSKDLSLRVRQLTIEMRDHEVRV